MKVYVIFLYEQKNILTSTQYCHYTYNFKKVKNLWPKNTEKINFSSRFFISYNKIIGSLTTYPILKYFIYESNESRRYSSRIALTQKILELDSLQSKIFFSSNRLGFFFEVECFVLNFDCNFATRQRHHLIRIPALRLRPAPAEW